LLPATTLLSRPALPDQATRIAFLCGCAEPGKDGVGDYTTLLAAECEHRGCATLRIALNDGYVTGEKAAAGALRLGAASEWPARIEIAREALDRFAPDAVSLQWVPYAFHPKGIPWGIEKGLARIIGGRAAQVMCHEIWIGGEKRASLAHRVAGAAQRAVLRRILRAMRPAIVQTSNPTYAALLAAAGIEAEVLQLFGAIPITGGAASRDPDAARFGMFGALHPEWPPEPLLGRLRELGKRIEIAHIGHIGRGEALWRELELRYRAEFSFRRHGEQPPARISQFLMDMDFGIAATPLTLLGKSGAAAAMLEHGLPVIVNRDDVQYPGIKARGMQDGVIVMDASLIQALRTAKRREPHSRLPAVAGQFLESLQPAPAAIP
jgi:glycosyltransferase involved in cell wall biosynthesis